MNSSIVFAAALGLAGFAGAAPPAQFGFNTIASGFTQPMSFAYAPDGRIFVAERAGIVKIVQADGSVSVFLDMRDQINSAWGRGILSIALDPNFASNRRFFMLYSLELDPANPDQGGAAQWRVARLQPRSDNPNAADLSTLTVLATDYETTAFKQDPHSGGDLDFDQDGNLLATFGDGGTPSALDPEALKTYDFAHLNGKMIRIDPATGNGLPSNPFYQAATPGSIQSKVLARGLRQPFRFTVDRATGVIYEGDVGWDTWEELNVISTAWANALRDQNMGWPCYEGGSGAPIKQPLYSTDSRTSGACNTVYGEGSKPAAYAYQHNGQGAAIIMGQVYRGVTYPGSYLGKVFWADFNRDEIWTYAPGAGAVQFGTTGGFGSMVDFEAAPDGNLAYLSYNEGRIREITYLGANHAPVANASASYIPGSSYGYNFSAAGTVDADGDALTYAWDFGDNATAAGPTATHLYNFGSYDATLTVADSKGAKSTKALHIDAGNHPPSVSFLSPADGSTYAAGDVVNFTLSAVDPEDGTLGPDKVTWQVILHHADHTHPDLPVQGLSGSFTATFPELVETYYELKAVARDNNGGIATASINIRARMADVTFVSSPAGAGLSVDGNPRSAPYTQKFIINSRHSALANATYAAGGNSYAFQSWNNNGAPTTTPDISFTVPDAPLTLNFAYGVPAFPQVYLRGTFNAWRADHKMDPLGGNRWATTATFGNAVDERFKFDILGDWAQNYGDNAPADGKADLGGADIRITQGEGSYRVTFDGNASAYAVDKIVVAQNPVAKAGADQSVSLAGGGVALDGSASSDPDGTIAAYAWRQISGSALAFSPANAAKAAVTVPAATAAQTFGFELTVTDNGGLTGADTVLINQAGAVSAWKRTVVFIHGQTLPGQNMFVRGGIDHGYAAANLGLSCTAMNYLCAIPITHNNLRNATTKPWKANDDYLDWYGTEAGQSAAAVGSPADWTTNAWPVAWGPVKTVAVDGYGVEPLNHWGQHYWMLDVRMDCSRTVNGWFELKSFISNGPGWEPNLAQPGAPYVSGNHFGKCGEVNMFQRGSNVWEHSPLP